MSEFTWYSRLAILGGSLVLIVQAATGRALAAVTVLAVIAVAAGLIAFIAGLIADGRRAERAIQMPSENDETAGSAAPTESDEADAPLPAGQPLQTHAVQAGTSDEPAAATPVPSSAPESPPVEAVVARSDGRVSSIRITQASAEHGKPCPHCGEALLPGQVAALCRVCGTPQHANCWIDADFHCSVEGCGGEGSLAPPERARFAT